MRIRLSDGTMIETSSASRNSYSGHTLGSAEPGSVAPSKHSNKVSSGRQGRKSHNGRRTIQAVGGYRSDIVAISQPADAPMCIIRTTTRSDERLRPMDQRILGLRPARAEYTWEVGGSCSTGYIGGRG